MALTLEDLLNPTTYEEALEAILGFLRLGDFPSNFWGAGSLPRRLAEAAARRYSDWETLLATIAKGGLIDLAEGPWLDLLAGSTYGLTRFSAQFTRGTIRLTDTGGSGPHIIAVRSLWAQSTSGKLYTNITGGTLSASGTIDLLWEAESPGADYNVPINSITTLSTPIAGVSVNNPGTSEIWISQQGTDEESDANLRARCKARWPGLGGGATEDVWIGWCLSASQNVTRVKVYRDNPLDGQVRIILAGPSGAVSSGVVANVQSYLDERTPLCVRPTAESAAVVAQAVTATIYAQTAHSGTAATNATLALTSYQNTLDIGQPVYRSALIEALMGITGAINTSVVTPALDVTVNPNEIVQLTQTITVVPV